MSWRPLGPLLLASLLASACATAPGPALDRTSEAGAHEPAAALEPWLATPGVEGPKLASLSAQPRHFDPEEGMLEIRFALGDAAEVRALIRDEAGVPVRVLEVGQATPGRLVVAWDGADARGRRVSSGLYTFAVEARAPDGAVSAIGPDPDFVPEEIIPQRFTYSAESGVVSYVLPRPAMVRLRAGVLGTMMVGTLLDWAPQTAGQHELAWDGTDESGLMKLGADPRMRLHLDAFRLAPNTIIVETAGEPARRTAAYAGPRGHRHARHDPRYCRSVEFSVELPDSPVDGQLQVPVLDGATPVRVTLDPEVAGHFIDRRFEVLVFVDSTFLFEEEEGVSPISYSLDTTQLAAGPHLLTVNIWTADDHSGVVTLPFLKR